MTEILIMTWLIGILLIWMFTLLGFNLRGYWTSGKLTASALIWTVLLIGWRMLT